MILAIGGAGGNVLATIERETKHPALINARHVFAYTNENCPRELVSGTEEFLLLDLESDVFPADVFEDVRKLTIIAGLGGRTGTKFTELAVKAAIEAGIADISVFATTPFALEGSNRTARATAAARRLTQTEGIRISVFDNETLLTRHPQLDLFNAFETVDREIMQAIENQV